MRHNKSGFRKINDDQRTNFTGKKDLEYFPGD